MLSVAIPLSSAAEFDFKEDGGALSQRQCPTCIHVVLFHSPTCEHCHRVQAYLDELKTEYPNLNVHRLSVLEPENQKLKEALELRRGLDEGVEPTTDEVSLAP